MASNVVGATGGAAVLTGGGDLEVDDLAESTRKVGDVVWEVLTGRTMLLLVGGLLIGYFAGSKGYEPVKPFFESGFRGALTIFLLEMGLTAGARLSDLKRSGLFLIGFGVAMPIVHGLLGVSLGTLAGLSVGGSAMLGTMAASASYIAAPPAVRMALPEANPTYSLTAALAITFPFNLVAGSLCISSGPIGSHGEQRESRDGYPTSAHDRNQVYVRAIAISSGIKLNLAAEVVAEHDARLGRLGSRRFVRRRGQVGRGRER